MKTNIFDNHTIIKLSFILPLLWSQTAQGALINFTLSLDSAKDPGANYNNFHEADAGNGNVYTTGFQIAINSVDGTNLNLSPIAAFCAELGENIGTSTYTFESAPLYRLSTGTAGQTGTASSGIPVGGIGVQRAANVRYLFDQYYISDALSEWTYTQAEPVTHAFQLAVWELTHDFDLSLLNTAGNIYIGNQTIGTATEIAQRNNAITLAEEMIANVKNANVPTSYASTNFTFWALINGDGITGNQDVILATKKGTSGDNTLEDLIPIPEPTTHMLIGLIAGSFIVIKRCFR